MTQTLVSASTAVELLAQAEANIAAALDGVQFGLWEDTGAVDVMGALERVGRRVDGGRVRSAADIGQRAEKDLGHGSLAWRLGCRGQLDLITAVTHVSGQEAKRRMQLGGLAGDRMQLGLVLPPLYPTVAAALASGELGVDSAEIIVKGLGEVSPRCTPEVLDEAERTLVASATGAETAETAGQPGSGIALPADVLRGLVQVMKARLDPDGVAPNDDVTAAKSSFSFGAPRDGVYPIRGVVTPELFGIINGVLDANLSARSRPSFPSAEQQALMNSGGVVPGADVFADGRTGGEKRADILRGVFESVARDPGTPSMGGAAPTVMVHVNAVDLVNGRGVGWIDGVETPVSLRTVERMMCAGGYQQIIFDENGAVLHLGEKQRCFSKKQRLAIAARDGGCIIPGCTVAARWCEVHHIIPWQHHGKTDVDNGTLLCYLHHQTIESSGWEIRMIRGRPQVRGPELFDPTRTWRPAASHRANQPSSAPPWLTGL